MVRNGSHTTWGTLPTLIHTHTGVRTQNLHLLQQEGPHCTQAWCTTCMQRYLNSGWSNTYTQRSLTLAPWFTVLFMGLLRPFSVFVSFDPNIPPVKEKKRKKSITGPILGFGLPCDLRGRTVSFANVRKPFVSCVSPGSWLLYPLRTISTLHVKKKSCQAIKRIGVLTPRDQGENQQIPVCDDTLMSNLTFRLKSLAAFLSLTFWTFWNTSYLSPKIHRTCQE